MPFSNTAPFTAPSSQSMSSMGGSSTGSGWMATAIVMSALMDVINSVQAGRVAKAQGDYNAAIAEGQAKWIDWEKSLENEKYTKFRNKFISSAIVASAGAGIALSGSPMASLLDSVTEINIDNAITQANLEQQKQYKVSEARMARTEGKNAQRAGVINAFSATLKGASNYALYKNGFNLNQGANKAGKP